VVYYYGDKRSSAGGLDELLRMGKRGSDLDSILRMGKRSAQPNRFDEMLRMGKKILC